MHEEYFAKEYLYTTRKTKTFSSNNFYMILFITSGKCSYTYEQQTTFCTTEDIILFNPNTTFCLEYSYSKVPLKFLQIGFTGALLDRLSDENTNLESCFHVVPYQCTCVHSSSEITMLIKNLSQKLLALPEEQDDFGHKLFEDSLLTMLIVLILRACIRTEFQTHTKVRPRLSLDDIFIFIKHHLHEEISLDRLEKEFYISKYHICREFKRQTGMTVHRYIVKSKLDLCKRLLEKGYPMIEIYKICGLGNYNHLFRAFKKEFGITPKEYVKQIQEQTSHISDDSNSI